MRQRRSSPEHRPGSGPAPEGVVSFSAIVRGWLVLAGGPHREGGARWKKGKVAGGLRQSKAFWGLPKPCYPWGQLRAKFVPHWAPISQGSSQRVSPGTGRRPQTPELRAEHRVPAFPSCRHSFAASVHRPGGDSYRVEGDRWPQMRGE